MNPTAYGIVTPTPRPWRIPHQYRFVGFAFGTDG